MPVDAVPPVVVRVAAAIGSLDEVTWEAPDIDVVGSVRVGDRAVVSGLAGYAILDDHTYLADGQDFRFQLSAGVRLGEALRISAALALELVAFNADPDVLATHPGVDLVPHHTATLPSAGIELRYPLTDAVAVGAFARAALRDLTLFDTGTGDHLAARLVMVGAFVELPIR